MKSIRLASILMLILFAGVQAASVASAAYSLIQDEGVSLARRQTLNFTGAGVTCSDSGGKTVCTITGGLSTAYTTIQDEGVALTQQATLNFIGADVTCVNDGPGNRTNCTISTAGTPYYQTIQDEGVALTQQPILNMTGAGVSCVNDGPGTRTTCTVAGAASGVSISSGAVASLPGSGTTSGDMYLPTDSVVSFKWNGSSWDAFHMMSKLVTPPASATGWSWTNQGTASVTVGNDGFIFDVQGTAGADNLRIYEKTMPATPYTLTVGLYPNVGLQNTAQVGISYRDSTSGRIRVFGYTLLNSGFYATTIFNYSSPTAFAGTVLQLSPPVSNVIWLRLSDNGTNTAFSLSTDNGNTFVSVYSTSRTAYVTTPDRIGIYSNYVNGTYSIKPRVFHWSVT